MARTWRRAAVVLLLSLFYMTCASADDLRASVSAESVLQVLSPSSGVLERIELEEGQRAQAGTVAATFRTERIFSPISGRVIFVHAGEGDLLLDTDAAITLSPTSRYLIYGTVSGTATTPEDALVHAGEELWIECTADGTHRAVGIVRSVSGDTFQVDTTGGELYIGETVYLLRQDGDSRTRIGRGTVVSQDPVELSSAGRVLRLRVQEGDEVERGQWLMTVAEDQPEVLIPEDGIVQKVYVSGGASVKTGDPLFDIACGRVLTAEDPEERIHPGQTLYYALTNGEDRETWHPCIAETSLLRPDGVRVWTLRPGGDRSDFDLLPLGFHVLVSEEPEE